ncbi:hypothetical protein B0H13DRAFT_124312 [Mycena leptocephala]|nr:hypothetical protein B0H13DRAFT_124312 [Mycena leptocephala]
MSEYDYTPAARRAYLANQSYVAKWASQSAPSPHTSFSGSPMMHRSHMPVDSPYTLYDLPSSSSHSSSSYSSRSSASRSHAPRFSATSTSRSSGSSSRWTSSPSTSSVTPSQSISQVSYRVSSSTHFPPSRSHPPHSPHHRGSHHISHRRSHAHRPSTYVIAPPAPSLYPYTQRAPGMIILSGRGGAPQVVFY